MRAALRGKAPGLAVERRLWATGHEVVAGLDEVGRGSWAGPLTVGAVVANRERRITGVRDSKLLTEDEREALLDRITGWAAAWSVGHASTDECDELGMSAAQRLAALRALMAEARKQKVVTQHGNQGHSSGDIRKCVEWIRDGAIGKVHTVHAACSAVHTRVNELPKRSEKQEIPKGLDWDLWQGPAAERSYHGMYLPGNWRAWRPYGNGTIGDWVCHVVDPSFWALDLGTPSSVEVLDMLDFDPKKHIDTFARGSRIRFEFPAKGERGPVTLYWYSGVTKIPRTKELGPGKKPPGTGAVIIGDKGAITPRVARRGRQRRTPTGPTACSRRWGAKAASTSMAVCLRNCGMTPGSISRTSNLRSLQRHRIRPKR